MADPLSFITVRRIEGGYRPVRERVQDFDEIELSLPEEDRRLQAARCMDCGVPFCHWACPVSNLMPEWQAHLERGDWKSAYDLLQSTNNFPEITGRVCPAPCEASCVLAINDDAVTIRENELAIIERAFSAGYVQPRPPKQRTGKKVAVIGSGPAGLACADSLNKAGHSVVLYEAADEVGGYLRFGIPDFKLDKRIIDRRINILLKEGLIIQTGVEVGRDLPVDALLAEFDAVCIAIGARVPRDLPVEGRDLHGIHFALDYLAQQNRVVRGDRVTAEERITAQGKHVVVIGGGDTGADCVGTANRQGAESVLQLEILPHPPTSRPPTRPWPLWPGTFKVSTSHLEGCKRLFSVETKKFTGEHGRVVGLSAVEVSWSMDGNGQYRMSEIAGTEFELRADLVLLALGFVHIAHKGLVEDLGVALDARGNVAVDANRMTSVQGVFAAGDSARGASLVVWAIQEGREAARSIDAYLQRKAT